MQTDAVMQAGAGVQVRRVAHAGESRLYIRPYILVYALILVYIHNLVYICNHGEVRGDSHTGLRRDFVNNP